MAAGGGHGGQGGGLTLGRLAVVRGKGLVLAEEVGVVPEGRSDDPAMGGRMEAAMGVSKSRTAGADGPSAIHPAIHHLPAMMSLPPLGA